MQGQQSEWQQNDQLNVLVRISVTKLVMKDNYREVKINLSMFIVLDTIFSATFYIFNNFFFRSGNYFDKKINSFSKIRLFWYLFGRLFIKIVQKTCNNHHDHLLKILAKINET